MKEEKKQQIRKQTRAKLDSMKNSDIQMVMDQQFKPDEGAGPSVFLTQDDEDGFPKMDPRQSVRLQKVREAKQKIDSEAEQYQEEVKKMQMEIKQYKEEIRKQQLAEKEKENQLKIKEQLAKEK